MSSFLSYRPKMYPTPQELSAKYRERKKKRFGQHFLSDPSILEAIVDLAELQSGELAIEIGPGCGALTTIMLQTGASVRALEIDRDLIAFLGENLAFENFELVSADAAKAEVFREGDPSAKVIANLPYNVASKILFRMLHQRDRWSRMVLMFQKEVADRIVAVPGTKAYGSMSVMSQLLSTPTYEMTLGAGAFFPPPKVDSAVVKFESKEVDLDESFEEMVRGAFAQRRKKMANSLANSGFEKQDVLDAMQEVGIDPQARAETVSPDVFVALHKAMR